jgi:hypothetical protein
MQANDRTLAHYLYDNRISPPPEFSAQIDAFCGQIKQRETRVSVARRNRKRKQKRKAHISRALVIAASVLFVVALSVMAIPSARAAVREWISGFFSIGDYLGQSSENRGGEPALDSIITKIEDDGRKIVITDINATDEAKRMADNFGIRLDEIVYTGSTVYMTGWFTGTSGKFLLDERTGGDTVHEDSEYTIGVMNLTLPDGTVYNGAAAAYFDDEMEQICSECPLDTESAYDAKGRLLTTNATADSLWYEWLKTHEVRFVMDARLDVVGSAGQSLSGQQTASLTLREYYHEKNKPVTLFQADLGTVTIDADAYKSVTTEQSGGQSVSLSGTHRMFLTENENQKTGDFVHSSVVDLDMTGVVVRVDSVKFTPTGMEVTLQMDLPEQWPRAERMAAIQGGENGGIGFVVLLDGQEIKHAFATISNDANSADKDNPFLTGTIVFSNSTLSRSQWDAIETISFIPYTGWPTELILEDLLHDRQEINRVKLEPGVIVTEQIDVTGTKRVDWIEDRMDDSALTIQLHDYR